MNTQRALRIPMIRLGIAVLILLVVVSIALLISFAWSLIHNSSTPSPIQADPLNMVDAFHSAINSNDVNAMLGLFTDDATVDDSGSVFQGREEIRNWVLHSQRMAGLHLRLVHSQVAGEKIFWHDLAHNGPEEQDRAYVLRWTAIIQESKIQSLTVSLLPMPDGK